jgi:hypothetical protein
MLRMLGVGLLVIGLLTVPAISPAVAYDNTTLHGWYAFRLSGVENVGTGRTVVGSGVLRFTINAAGQARVTGRATLKGFIAGDCSGNVSGPYVVNPDGTGSIFTGFFPDCPQSPTTLNFNIAVVNGGNGFEMVANANDFLWGTATRRGPGPYGPADLAGSFGFRVVSLEPSFEEVLSGVMTLDGTGLLTRGRVTVLRSGFQLCPGSVIPLSSTYTLNADGTGTLALGIQYDTCAGTDLWFLSIAVFRSGRGFEMASSAQGLVSGTATRQEPLEP